MPSQQEIQAWQHFTSCFEKKRYKSETKDQVLTKTSIFCSKPTLTKEMYKFQEGVANRDIQNDKAKKYAFWYVELCEIKSHSAQNLARKYKKCG